MSRETKDKTNNLPVDKKLLESIMRRATERAGGIPCAILGLRHFEPVEMADIQVIGHNASESYRKLMADRYVCFGVLLTRHDYSGYHDHRITYILAKPRETRADPDASIVLTPSAMANLTDDSIVGGPYTLCRSRFDPSQMIDIQAIEQQRTGARETCERLSKDGYRYYAVLAVSEITKRDDEDQEDIYNDKIILLMAKPKPEG